VQLLGGNGYMKDYPQEKRMRDAKQVQSLLGMAPVRKIQLIEHIAATES
jgi:alkylation response protein AidB-like acyl-CoA dehydrogenase